jgi:metal-responsive CopG/Arc/MetJ family transcriptional regulator
LSIELAALHMLTIDNRYTWWYVRGMKIKTSITLSDDILKAIDLHAGNYKSRSEFIETATRIFIEQLKKKEAEQRDLEILNNNSETLNHEAEDVLGYQVPI